MRCDERRVVAFLAGDLPSDEARDFDLHLLGCERCWASVQEDRAGRAALARIRQPAPEGLGDRVAMAVHLAAAEAPQAGSARRGRPREGWRGGRAGFRLAMTGAAALVAVSVGIVTWRLTTTPAPTPAPAAAHGEPAQIAAVLEAEQSSGGAHRAGAVMHMRAGGHRIEVRFFEMHGSSVAVATSPAAFPMPAHPRAAAGSSPTDWMATDGRYGIYCVNRLHGDESMLVVAAMPAAELPQVAAELHLL